ncbi:MAG: cbb3-type cytochrome oxidase assembly protein CcoS [Planctomycetota bacterium]
MDILYIAIPLALAVAAFFLIAFLWSVRTGQLDDLETPAIRMLFEEDTKRPREPNSGAPAPQPPENHLAEDRSAPPETPQEPGS